MLRLELLSDELKRDPAFPEYCEQIFESVNEDIKLTANPKKYQVRVPLILALIKWRITPPETIDLMYYVTNCLELKPFQSGYVIELNDRAIVPGSVTLVKDLIRLLEYGNEVLPPYPLIRDILSSYQQSLKL